jgi:hypothetical protein
VFKSAIAHRTLKNEPHARTSHLHFQILSARTSARTFKVRRCDNTHMCAATQCLNQDLYGMKIQYNAGMLHSVVIFSLLYLHRDMWRSKKSPLIFRMQKGSTKVPMETQLPLDCPVSILSYLSHVEADIEQVKSDGKKLKFK